MDYRLVPYIKKYLHEGHSLEQIRQSLLSQGVPEMDIKQAAVYAMDEGTKEIKKKNNLLWILPILLILIIGGVGYYFLEPIKTYTTDMLGQFSTTKENFDEGVNTEDDQLTNNNQIIGQNMQQEQCDMNCLITAAETCNSARTEFSAETDFFGMIISSKNYYEIKPGQKCGVYIKTIDGNVEFSQELREQSIANGITETELELQLVESRKGARANIGKEGICTFEDTSKLKEFLEKIRDGTFNADVSCTLETDGSRCIYGGDWALGECTGSMFPQY